GASVAVDDDEGRDRRLLSAAIAVARPQVADGDGNAAGRKRPVDGDEGDGPFVEVERRAQAVAPGADTANARHVLLEDEARVAGAVRARVDECVGVRLVDLPARLGESPWSERDRDNGCDRGD